MLPAKQIKISLKAARVNAGYSLVTAAEKLHISKNTLNNWELGVSEPKTSQARQLSELYNMPYDAIIFMPSKSN